MRSRLMALLVLLAVVCPERCIASIPGYQFRNIADNAGVGPFGADTFFWSAATSGDAVAFLADDAQTMATEIYLARDASLTRIVGHGDPAPSGEFEAISWLGQGPDVSEEMVAFLGGYLGRSGIFVGEGGSLTAIAKTEDPAPTGPYNFYAGLLKPWISGRNIAFTGVFENSRAAAFLSKSGMTTVLVRDSDPAPYGYFRIIQVADISGDRVVMTNSFGFGYGNEKLGIFTSSGGSLTEVVPLGDETSLSGVTAAFSVTISGNRVAFVGLDAPGDTWRYLIGESDYHLRSAVSGGTSGVFTGGDGPLRAVARRGDIGPEGAFRDFLSAAISGDTVAFLAGYGTAGDFGLFVSQQGVTKTVLRNGDSLFGEIVTDLEFEKSGLDDSGSGSLAFRYSLADGRHGIALATPIPEPTSMISLLFAVGALPSIRAGGIGWRLRRPLPREFRRLAERDATEAKVKVTPI